MIKRRPDNQELYTDIIFFPQAVIKAARAARKLAYRFPLKSKYELVGTARRQYMKRKWRAIARKQRQLETLDR